MAKKRTKKSVSKTKRTPRKKVGFAAKVVLEIQTLLKKQIGKKITLKEIRAMLRYLLDNYNDVSYKKGILTLQTDAIYKRDRNIGPFDMTLDLKKIDGDKNGDCHYHVLTLYPNGEGHIYSNGRLCFGDGWCAARKSLNDGRIDDFVDIIQQILRT